MSNNYVNTSISLPEILAKIAAFQGSIDEKANLLRVYDSASLRWFVDVMYHAPLKDIEIPKYVESQLPIGNHYMTIQSVRVKLEAIIAEPKTIQSQNQLRLILQNVHADEAKLIANLLQGKKIDGISKAVFRRAFPEFFPVNDQPTLEDTQED